MNNEKIISRLKTSTEEKIDNYEVRALYFDHDSNNYEIFHTFNFTIYQDCETLVINLNDNVKLSYINKEVIGNLLYFAGKICAKTIYMVLNRKNKDFGK